MRFYGPGVPRATRKLVKASIVNMDTTGIKISYTVPTGKSAYIKRCTLYTYSGNPSGRYELVSAGTTYIISGSISTGYISTAYEYFLASGDTIQFNVTLTGGAGSTADLTYSLEEEC